jgi:hypothetical protein
LFLAKGRTVITGSTIRGNTAVYNGGGIATGTTAFATEDFTSLTISKSNISGNRTTATKAGDHGGGGLFAQGNSAGALEPVLITHSVFADNGSAKDGGGVHASNGVALTVSASAFIGNSADRGGGVSATGINADTVDFAVSGSTFFDNTVTREGGGICVISDGAVAISESTISGNTASGFGGGFYTQEVATAKTVTLKNVVVTGNFSKFGGGGISLSRTTDFKMTGGSVLGNSTTAGGGGIDSYNTKTSILGVTISGNAAATGGGVFNEGSAPGVMTLQVAKVTGNTAPTDPNVSGTNITRSGP